jgi:hypothetical protein
MIKMLVILKEIWLLWKKNLKMKEIPMVKKILKKFLYQKRIKNQIYTKLNWRINKTKNNKTLKQSPKLTKRPQDKSTKDKL